MCGGAKKRPAGVFSVVFNTIYLKFSDSKTSVFTDVFFGFEKIYFFAEEV